MGKQEPFLCIFSDAGVERHGVAGEQRISMFLGINTSKLRAHLPILADGCPAAYDGT